MPLHETESIVLKSYNLAEADRIVVFFTRGFGVVRGVAKGARRIKSKFGSALEPFSQVSLEYFQKDERELVSIQSAEIVRSAFYSAADPERLETYSRMADLLLAFAPPHDPNETLYRMFSACLEVKLVEARDHSALDLYYKIWLLRLGGYLPDWRSCSSCRRELARAESATLISGSQLVCGSCLRSRAGDTVSPLHRSVFHNVQKQSPADFVSGFRDEHEAVKEVSVVIERIVATVIGREIRDFAAQDKANFTTYR
ncbi:MAG TPA: DNA repair protein RecO [Pyrinomonadaceae bacterium]|nr:DNA repair protein RecO [Pyrinomonadaceae bacterium]